MAKPTPQYNLSPMQALAVLREQSLKNRTQTEAGLLTEQLQDISSEASYDIGYATAIHDFESLTGPDPLEVHIIGFEKPEGMKNYLPDLNEGDTK